jgi:hypothetical protein
VDGHTAEVIGGLAGEKEVGGKGLAEGCVVSSQAATGEI